MSFVASCKVRCNACLMTQLLLC